MTFAVRMRRELLLLTFCHLFLGFITCGVGVAWIVLYFLDEKFQDERLPHFAYLAMLPEIICGFLIFVCGGIGYAVNSKSSLSGLLFLTCNIFNLLVWAPVLAAGYSLLVITMYGTETLCGLEQCLPKEWESYNLQYLLPAGESWGYAFPGIGITVGFIDFLVSLAVLFTYCCSPGKKESGELHLEDEGN